MLTHCSCPLSMLHKTTGYPRLPLLLTALFRCSQNLVPSHQVNFPRPRNKRPLLAGYPVADQRRLCCLRLPVRYAHPSVYRCMAASKRTLSPSVTLPAVVRMVLAVNFGPSPFVTSGCPKTILYSIKKPFTNLGNSWWMNWYFVLHYGYASLNDGNTLRNASLGNFVVVRTSYSVLTQTQTVQYSLLHT